MESTVWLINKNYINLFLQVISLEIKKKNAGVLWYYADLALEKGVELASIFRSIKLTL